MPARGRWSAGGRRGRGRGRAEGDGMAMSRTTMGGFGGRWLGMATSLLLSLAGCSSACVCVCVCVCGCRSGAGLGCGWLLVAGGRCRSQRRGVTASHFARQPTHAENARCLPDACQMPDAKCQMPKCRSCSARAEMGGEQRTDRQLECEVVKFGRQVWNRGLAGAEKPRCRDARCPEQPRSALNPVMTRKRPACKPRGLGFGILRSGFWDSGLAMEQPSLELFLLPGPRSHTARPLLCRSSLGCWPVSTQPTKAHQSPPKPAKTHHGASTMHPPRSLLSTPPHHQTRAPATPGQGSSRLDQGSRPGPQFTPPLSPPPPAKHPTRFPRAASTHCNAP